MAAPSISSPILGALLLVVLIAGCGDSVKCSELRVTPSQWRSIDARSRLAAGLVDCGALRKRTRAEVVGMLGEPDDRRGRSWDYFVGGGFIDDRYLYLRFDRRGRVANVELDPS